MRSLGFFNKIVFVGNVIFSFLLLVGYLLPYIPPRVFPEISVLTLVLPALIILNLLFLTYWVIFLKKQFLLSAVVLILGFFQHATLYEFYGKSEEASGSFKIMSYNVRMFNINKPLKDNEIPSKISTLVHKEDPDIMLFQEYTSAVNFPMGKFKHKYVKLKGKHSNSFGLAIFTKYKIINKGSLDFPNSSNNGIYVDILKGKDTLRIYNLHMQSLALQPEIGELRQENSKKLLGRLGEAFKQQQQQAEIFLAHQAKCPYTIILGGDFNNTAFSFAYKKIRGDKLDAFEEAGSGFGRTFIFDFIPLRIDFLLCDDSIQVLGFKNFKQEYSDHYPILAKMQF